MGPVRRAARPPAGRQPRVVVSRSAAATARLGRRLGALLRHGDVVALVGDLGAGKTQLTRGACEGAGVAPGDVCSPTFAIVQTYRGRLPVHHADLYRLGDLDELYATGFMDLLGGPGALLVEWADRIDGWLPPAHLLLRLVEVKGHPTWRRITLEPAGARHAELARALASRSRPGAGSRSGAGSKSGASSRSRPGHRPASRPGRRPAS
jgi:tRNA threonylcarbamoyladenosine biosynthesis protein TsaE